jgi:hypothetical protein
VVIWTKKKIASIPQNSARYPKWTFCKIDGEYWLILDKTRLRFISERAFESWGRTYVLASNESVSKYAIWKDVGFAPGTMIRAMNSSNVYFISGSDVLNTERRLIATPDFYDKLGFDTKNVIIVSDEELLWHREGTNIDGAL